MISRLLEGLYGTSKRQNLTMYNLFYIFTASFDDRDNFSAARTDHNIEELDGARDIKLVNIKVNDPWS